MGGSSSRNELDFSRILTGETKVQRADCVTLWPDSCSYQYIRSFIGKTATFLFLILASGRQCKKLMLAMIGINRAGGAVVRQNASGAANESSGCPTGPSGKGGIDAPYP